MPKPWIDSPELVCRPDQPLLGLTGGDVAPMLPHALEMLGDLRSQFGDEVRLEFAEHVDSVTGGRFRAEAEAWAGLLGLSWQEVLLGNCAYDAAIRVFMCSGAAIETPDGPVLARNMDWWHERPLARGSVMLRYALANPFMTAGWIGSIGAVSGMSSRGFALAMNAVLCEEPLQPDGYPVLLFLRALLEDAGSYSEALDMLCAAPLASPCLVLLVGSSNEERVVVERTPRRHALRRGEPGKPLIVTNDYRAMHESVEAAMDRELYRTACGRYERLEAQLVSDEVDPSRDDAMLFALSDRGVRMDITAQQMVFRPAEQRSRLVSPGWFFESSS